MAINFGDIEQSYYNENFPKQFIKPIQDIMKEYGARPSPVNMPSLKEHQSSVTFYSDWPNLNITISNLSPGYETTISADRKDYVVKIDEALESGELITTYFHLSKPSILDSKDEKISCAFTALKKSSNGKIKLLATGPNTPTGDFKNNNFESIIQDSAYLVKYDSNYPFAIAFYNEDTLDGYAQISGKTFDESSLSDIDQKIGYTHFPKHKSYVTYDSFEIVNNFEALPTILRENMYNKDLNVRKGR